MNPSSRQSPDARKGKSWVSIKRMVAIRPRRDPRWESINALKRSAEQALAPYEELYHRRKRVWDKKLLAVCGNLGGLEWSDFRPLRLSREEDWSDWLAWLLETSTTGALAESLFGTSMDCGRGALKRPRVTREDRTEERRA